MELAYNCKINSLQDLILLIWPTGTSIVDRNACAVAMAKCKKGKKVSMRWILSEQRARGEEPIIHKITDPLPPEWGDKAFLGGKYAFFARNLLNSAPEH